MTDAQKKAAEALSADGYRYDEVMCIWRRCDIDAPDYCEVDIDFAKRAVLSLPIEEAVRLLSPSTPPSLEEVRKAVHEVVFDAVRIPALVLGPNLGHELVNAIAARLQQHTQTTPAPAKAERFHQLTPDEVMEEITRQGLAATTKEGNGE